MEKPVIFLYQCSERGQGIYVTRKDFFHFYVATAGPLEASKLQFSIKAYVARAPEQTLGLS